MAEFDIRERLTQKLGPLPVWGWGVIVGVIVLVGYFLYSRTRSGSISDMTTASQSGSNIDGMGYYTTGIKGAAGANDNIVTPENNMAWLTRVSRQVADTLGKSPSEIYAALYKYISGQDYTAKEKEYIDKAIMVGMSPPEGTQGVGKVVDPIAVENSRDKARRILNEVFGGTFTDAIARLIYPTASVESSVDTWAGRIDAGASEVDIRNAIRSGPTYQKWIQGQGR